MGAQTLTAASAGIAGFAESLRDADTQALATIFWLRGARGDAGLNGATNTSPACGKRFRPKQRRGGRDRKYFSKERRAGTRRRHGGTKMNRMTRDKEKAICEGYKNGCSIAQLKDELHISYGTIKQVLMRHGIRRRSPGERPGEQRHGDIQNDNTSDDCFTPEEARAFAEEWEAVCAIFREARREKARREADKFAEEWDSVCKALREGSQ